MSKKTVTGILLGLGIAGLVIILFSAAKPPLPSLYFIGVTNAPGNPADSSAKTHIVIMVSNSLAHPIYFGDLSSSVKLPTGWQDRGVAGNSPDALLKPGESIALTFAEPDTILPWKGIIRVGRPGTITRQKFHVFHTRWDNQWLCRFCLVCPVDVHGPVVQQVKVIEVRKEPEWNYVRDSSP
jgi:hypothetical protein